MYLLNRNQARSQTVEEGEELASRLCRLQMSEWWHARVEQRDASHSRQLRLRAARRGSEHWPSTSHQSVNCIFVVVCNVQQAEAAESRPVQQCLRLSDCLSVQPLNATIKQSKCLENRWKSREASDVMLQRATCNSRSSCSHLGCGNKWKFNVKCAYQRLSLCSASVDHTLDVPAATVASWPVAVAVAVAAAVAATFASNRGHVW